MGGEARAYGPTTIAVCCHPDGLHEHWEVSPEEIQAGLKCITGEPGYGCHCRPALYVLSQSGALPASSDTEGVEHGAG